MLKHGIGNAEAIGVVEDQVGVDRLAVHHGIADAFFAEAHHQVAFIGVAVVQEAHGQLDVFAGSGDEAVGVVGDAESTGAELGGVALVEHGEFGGSQVKLGIGFLHGAHVFAQAAACPHDGGAGLGVEDVGVQIRTLNDVAVEKAFVVPLGQIGHSVLHLGLDDAVANLAFVVQIEPGLDAVCAHEDAVAPFPNHQLIGKRSFHAHVLKGGEGFVPLVDGLRDLKADFL